MINLMKYKEVATYDSPDAPVISGREADDRYNPASILNKIGASIVFAADVVDNHVGDEDWDRIAIVRYATRRSFIEMQSRKDFGEKHVHKSAGMARTTIVAGRPLDLSLDTRERPTPIEFRWMVMVVRQVADRDAVLASVPTATSFTAEGTVIEVRRFELMFTYSSAVSPSSERDGKPMRSAQSVFRLVRLVNESDSSFEA